MRNMGMSGSDDPDGSDYIDGVMMLDNARNEVTCTE